jgi:hypothetical protein
MADDGKESKGEDDGGGGGRLAVRRPPLVLQLPAQPSCHPPHNG